VRLFGYLKRNSNPFTLHCDFSVHFILMKYNNLECRIKKKKKKTLRIVHDKELLLFCIMVQFGISFSCQRYKILCPCISSTNKSESSSYKNKLNDLISVLGRDSDVHFVYSPTPAMLPLGLSQSFNNWG